MYGILESLMVVRRKALQESWRHSIENKYQYVKHVMLEYTEVSTTV